jgi:hypothetical protein
MEPQSSYKPGPAMPPPLYTPTTPPESEIPNSVPPQQPPQVPQDSLYTVPPKKSKLGLIIGVIVLLILVGVVSAYAFTMKSETPRDIIVRSILSYKDITSLGFDAKIEGKVTPDDPSLPFATADYSIRTAGKVGFNKDGLEALDMTFGAKLDADDGTAKSGFDADLRILGTPDMGYIQINDLDFTYQPKTPDPSTDQLIAYVQTALNKVKGQWISFEIDDSKPTKTPEKEDSEVGKKIASLDYIDKFENLGEEPINNVVTTHFRLTVNNAKFKEISDEIQKVSSQYIPGYLAAVGAATTATGETTIVDMWIGKKDNHFYRITFSEITMVDDESKTSVSMKGSLDFTGYNEPVSVTPPATSMTSQQFMNQLLGPMMMPMPSNSTSPVLR